MKLTNEDLRTIIFEETNSVLKEFHAAVDGDSEAMVKTKEEEDNPPATTVFPPVLVADSQDIQTIVDAVLRLHRATAAERPT